MKTAIKFGTTFFTLLFLFLATLPCSHGEEESPSVTIPAGKFKGYQYFFAKRFPSSRIETHILEKEDGSRIEFTVTKGNVVFFAPKSSDNYAEILPNGEFCEYTADGTFFSNRFPLEKVKNWEKATQEASIDFINLRRILERMKASPPPKPPTGLRIIED